MSKLQNVSSIIGRRNSFRAVTLIPSTSLYQVERLQTTQAAEGDEHTNKSEWDRARPLREIPTYSPLSMLCKYLPGGKFYNSALPEILELINKEHGPIFNVPAMLGMKSLIISYDPVDFEKIFRTEGVWPERRPLAILNRHRSQLRKNFFQGVEGLVHTKGEQWGSFRSAANPVLMQPRTIKSYIPKISKVNWEFIQRIKDIRDPDTLEVPDNFEDELNRYSLEAVSVLALDQEIGAIRGNRDDLEVQKLFTDLTTFFRLSYELEIEPSMWKIFPTLKYREMISAMDGINDFVIKYIDNAIVRLEKSPSNKPESEKGVLEKLLKIDKKIATVMAMDMLMVGVDTTSSSLAGLLLCLAKNPDKQQKLRDELRQVLPQKDSPFNEENMSKMPYLRACIKESQRYYPLSLGNIRTTGKDLVLNGYRIPKGTDVSMVSLLFKDDPQYYVEPKKFLPERWLRRSNTDKDDGVLGSSSSNPFVYLPFGFGPRMCIGRRIVDLEMEITVARIIRNFNLEFNYPSENPFKSLIINVPAIPLRFKFTDIQ